MLKINPNVLSPVAIDRRLKAFSDEELFQMYAEAIAFFAGEEEVQEKWLICQLSVDRFGSYANEYLEIVTHCVFWELSRRYVEKFQQQEEDGDIWGDE